MKVFLLILMIAIVIEIPLITYMYKTDMERMEKNEPVLYSTWGKYYYNLSLPDKIVKDENVNFIKTYKVIKKLNIDDESGNYTYYVVEQFKSKRPGIAKIDKTYTLEENKCYEIKFNGNSKITNYEYDIEEIFNSFNITSVELTEKIGLDQINEDF